MKLQSVKYFVFPAILAFLSGCEDDVRNVKLPEFGQKLVIASYISPSDSDSYFYVNSNRRIYGELNQTEPVGNLSGTISDGTDEVILDTATNGLKLSKGKLRIQNGKTYTLNIESDRGLSADAVCIVPEKRDFYLHADTFSILHEVQNYKPWRELRINVSFTDYPDEENYYRLRGEFTGYYTSPVSHYYFNSYEPLYFEKEYFTDSDADNDRQIFISSGIPSAGYFDSAFIKINLLNTEKSYFLYHKSLEKYNQEDNPFTEPTPVYSNVNRGLGIFTSYTIESYVIRLK